MTRLQPSCSSPSRFATGTRTRENSTWFRMCVPPKVVIGTTVSPGEDIGTQSTVIPCCFLPERSVRNRPNIQLA